MGFQIEDAENREGAGAIVTGSNVGLGFETAVGLAKTQCTVVLACRNEEKADKAISQIRGRVKGAKLDFIELDLSSFASIQGFSDTFLKKYERLDLLINNAGIMMTPFGLSEDGFEQQFAVNHLGHFLLTGLLLPLIGKTPSARVVSVSSLAHLSGDLQFDTLNEANRYSRFGAYAQSKLACLVFAYELQRRLEKAGIDAISVAAHPGASNTELGRNLPALVRVFVPLLAFPVTHSIENAARTTLYAALGGDIAGGDYTGPTGFREMFGEPGKVDSTSRSKDANLGSYLWIESEKMTGFRYLS